MDDVATGQWVPHPDNPQGRIWAGPSAWETEVGISKIQWLYGSIHQISDAIAPGNVLVNLQSIDRLVSGFGYYHQDENDVCIYGSIEMGEEGVEFSPFEVQEGPHAKILKSDSLFVEVALANRAFIQRIHADAEFAESLYGALCYNTWFHESPLGVVSLSTRSAAALVAALRQKNEPYTDFYLSLNEGEISPDIAEVFKAMGWSLLEEMKPSGKAAVVKLMVETIEAEPDTGLATLVWRDVFADINAPRSIAMYVQDSDKFIPDIEAEISNAMIIGRFLRHAMYVGRLPKQSYAVLRDCIHLFSEADLAFFINKLRSRLQTNAIRPAEELADMIANVEV